MHGEQPHEKPIYTRRSKRYAVMKSHCTPLNPMLVGVPTAALSVGLSITTQSIPLNDRMLP
jgi:hypothetical protein